MVRRRRWPCPLAGEEDAGVEVAGVADGGATEVTVGAVFATVRV